MCKKNDERCFWEKVNKRGPCHPYRIALGSCWLWRASKGKGGYGNFKYNNKLYRAHRIAWQLTNGTIPEGMFICHSCDNPACVNPLHLFVGTHKQNMEDRNAKGRIRWGWKPRRGSKHPKSKLTEENVREIRKTYAEGKMLMCELATKFGVSNPNIQSIIHGVTWKHLL